MGLSNGLSCEAGSFSRCLNPRGVFSQRFQALFSHWNPGLCICLTPQLSLPVYLYMNVGPPVLQPPPHLRVLCTQLPISAPPAGLGECFFFNSLVVGRPYSSIFCQFWLFLFLNLLSFWLCEAQCVYLHLHLGHKSCFSLKILLTYF